ncbi:MAG: peptidase [Bdellovibrionaceae bacterium]|nr:peptidase [Pseudobdellovibrionaceae bacterium]NUM60000.1 peptidase [Pseudobdellovibrionaceae bacterium]
MKVSAPWGNKEKEDWLKKQTVKRSYLKEVVTEVEKLQAHFEVIHYGNLSINPKLYPLYFVKSKKFYSSKKTIIITGGVHGYETSGVHGALAFMTTAAFKYSDKFNFICAPCISPWAYETVNRWNPQTIDPNRSFFINSPAEECSLFLNAMSVFIPEIFAHFDLHETTNTDNTVFRPTKALRDGTIEDPWSEIPDGFYLVGDTENPCPDFQKAIISSVKKVTHIALEDKNGKLIGENLQQQGVINYPLKKLSLCTSFSNASYTTTTEVYPDSPKVTVEICINAQVAAIIGGLDYLSSQIPGG